MVRFLKLSFPFFLLLCFFLSFSSSVSAAGGTFCGVGGCFVYDAVANTVTCETTVTTSDLSPCIDSIGGYSNTCCTNGGGCIASGDGSSLRQWDYNFASGCTASKVFGGSCRLSFKYDTQTCPATDSCVSPKLNPGLCTNSGCAVSSTPYKTCCSNGSEVACFGGQYTGYCPSGTTTEFCGYAPYPDCGQAACGSVSTPTPAPTAQPCINNDPCTASQLNSSVCSASGGVKTCLNWGGTYCWGTTTPTCPAGTTCFAGVCGVCQEGTTRSICIQSQSCNL